jgi:glycogen debranching enzyme
MDQIKADDQFYVMATHSLTEEKTFLLKHNDSFAIFNRYGDIYGYNKSTQGIFHKGTRFLSDYQLKLEGRKPLYLSSDIKEGNELFSVDLTNPDITRDNILVLEKGLIHIMRKKVLWENAYYEQIYFYNYGLDKIEFKAELRFYADYSDIFEVRGTERPKKGTIYPALNENKNIILKYRGLDQVVRSTVISLQPLPDQLDENTVTYDLKLSPGQSFSVSLKALFLINGAGDEELLNFQAALKKNKRRLEYIQKNSVDIFTSNEQFNHWITRSKADLITMITETPLGPFPYAGIPWYNTPFGRDAIITALECLWVSPDVAKGVLLYLAKTQAIKSDSFRDAEPGKILHESRDGEMAELNEIPFKQYYGSIDSTPLFIVLAGAYYTRTKDIGTIKDIWLNIELALDWIDKYGDIDNDLFVEYKRKEKSGLFNQGWKDSHDSVSYIDGRLAEPPIALCEIQGYVYDAWLKAASLSEVMDMNEKASVLRKKASDLKKKFQEEYWSEDKSVYYLALAGEEKRPCNIVASNTGHCLFSRIASQDHAEKIASVLLSNNMFTSWGIRTLASDEVRYNPMSYHNGSVWPHDNAIIAYGFANYGLKDEVKKLITGLFDASLFLEGQRLPELFCGFKRRPGEAPTAYPVACSPQAWSVASVFMVIQALLGMDINEAEDVIRFYKPVLPDFIEKLEVRNISFRNQRIDLEFVKTGENVNIGLLNNDIPVKIEITY